MISAILLSALIAAGPAELPPTWAGDIGAPVNTPYGTVYLYGDTMAPEGNFIQGTSIIVNGVTVTNVVPRSSPDLFYWPRDATQLPGGPLMVILDEVRQTGDCTWCFQSVDIDAFFVTGDPAVRANWTWALKVDAGWWDTGTVAFDAFIDDQPFAVGSTDWGAASIRRIDAYGDAVDDDFIVAEFPASSGPFVPVEVDGEWWGVSSAIWGTMGPSTVVALWHADDKAGPYEWVRTIDNVGETYAHHLAVIDGVPYHYFSTLNGRVTYQEVSL